MKDYAAEAKATLEVILARPKFLKHLREQIEKLGSPLLLNASEIEPPPEMSPHQFRALLNQFLCRLGYVRHRNPNIADGRWKVNKRLVVVYKKVGQSKV